MIGIGRLKAWCRVLGACGLVCAVALPGRTQPAPGGASPALASAQAYLVARWKAVAACDKRIELALDIDKAEPAGPVLQLKGKAKGTVPGPDGKGAAVDAVLAGRYEPASGLLSLDATLVPDDPDYCPTVKLLGRCVVVTGILTSNEKLMEKHRQERAALANTSNFRLEVARDEAGRGLVGTVRGRAFDCADMTLTRADGAPPSVLPAPTADTEKAGLGRVDGTPVAGTTSQAPARRYWLEAVGKRGDAVALSELGFLAEKFTTPPDWPAAVAHYRKAADAGEVRAQRRLSELLAQGQGVPQDQAESARWAQRAKATTAEVGRYCVAPAMVTAYRDLLESLKRDPANLMLSFFGTALTGLSFDEGSFQIEGVGVEGVTLTDGPFICRIVGRRVGASVRNLRPAFAYAGEDSYGRALYFDNRGDVAINEAVASLTTTLANKVQATQPFQVQPLGNNRYRVVLVQQLIATGTTHATEVTIAPGSLPPAVAPAPADAHAAPPAAPDGGRGQPGTNAAEAAREEAVWGLCQSASTPAMCQAYVADFPRGPHREQALKRLAALSATPGGQPGAPPGGAAPANPSPGRPAPNAPPNAPPNTPPAPPPSAGNDDGSAAVIDAGFAEWSREWRADRYLLGSVQLGPRQCARDSCQISGEFRLRRAGTVMSLPFQATLTRRGQGRPVLNRLCTTDRATGATDCADF